VRSLRTPTRSSRPILPISAGVALLALLTFGVAHELPASIPAEGLERAIAAQRALVAERPKDATAVEDLGSLLSLAGDQAGAEEAYRQAITLDPQSASAHFQLGTALERRGEERKALSEYKRALDLDPTHAWARYEAGTIYARWGLDSAAKKSYARAFALDPALADPSVNPHVLENSLATAALIVAYRDYRPEPALPKTFHEPGRIAGLILARPSADELAATEKPEPPLDEEPGGYARMEGGAAERGIEGVDEGVAEPVDKVLTTQDLDPSSQSGQVAGGAVAGSKKSAAEAAAERAKAREASRQRAGGSMAVPTTPSSSRPLNPIRRPPTHPPAGGGGTGAGGGAGGGGGAPFQPAPNSTGAIDVRIEEIPG
jgi:tetratricopeptide (TPR) repeat protein